MPGRPVFRAGDPGCQVDIDRTQDDFERRLGKVLVSMCYQCGVAIRTTFRELTAQPGAEVQAPSRCRACRGEG